MVVMRVRVLVVLVVVWVCVVGCGIEMGWGGWFVGFLFRGRSSGVGGGRVWGGER